MGLNYIHNVVTHFFAIVDDIQPIPDSDNLLLHSMRNITSGFILFNMFKELVKILLFLSLDKFWHQAKHFLIFFNKQINFFTSFE